MGTPSIGTSDYGVVVAGCQLLPAVGPGGKLGFKRGLHIASVTELAIGPGIRAWQLTIDDDTPEASFSYVPHCTQNSVFFENGDTPGAAFCVPRVHRVTPQGGHPLVYQVAIVAAGARGGAGGPGWPAYGQIRATMPGDNAATIAQGAPILFPTTDVLAGGVTSVGGNRLVLPVAGEWRIRCQVSITEPAQLVVALRLGGVGAFVELPETVVGRATGTNQVIIDTIVSINQPNSEIQIWNPAGEATALTITPIAGGVDPVNATFSAELQPLANEESVIVPTFIDPTSDLVGAEGFSFTLHSTGLDFLTAP